MQPTLCDTCCIKAVAAKAKALSEMPAGERAGVMGRLSKQVRKRNRAFCKANPEQCKP